MQNLKAGYLAGKGISVIMFVRVKKTEKHEYLQIVENTRVGKNIRQRVLFSLGRIDQPRTKERIQRLLDSLNGGLKKLKN